MVSGSYIPTPVHTMPQPTCTMSPVPIAFREHNNWLPVLSLALIDAYSMMQSTSTIEGAHWPQDTSAIIFFPRPGGGFSASHDEMLMVPARAAAPPSSATPGESLRFCQFTCDVDAIGRTPSARAQGTKRARVRDIIESPLGYGYV